MKYRNYSSMTNEDAAAWYAHDMGLEEESIAKAEREFERAENELKESGTIHGDDWIEAVILSSLEDVAFQYAWEALSEALPGETWEFTDEQKIAAFDAYIGAFRKAAYKLIGGDE